MPNSPANLGERRPHPRFPVGCKAVPSQVIRILMKSERVLQVILPPHPVIYPSRVAMTYKEKNIVSDLLSILLHDPACGGRRPMMER